MMNKYSAYEALNQIDDRFVAEAAEKRNGRRAFKKSRLVAVAAVAAVVLCGTVAAAAGMGGLEKISGFFSNRSARYAEYDRLPALVNPADYAVGLESDVHPLEGTAAFVSASVSDHFVYAMVEYGVEDEVLAALPEGAKLSFDWRKSVTNLSGTTRGVSPVSLDGNILTVMVYEGGSQSIPDEMQFTLRNLGYADENYNFVTLRECEIEMTLPKSEVAVIPATQALNTSTFDGIEFRAEISPLGVLLSCDSSLWYEKYESNKATRGSKELGINYMQFYLSDGTVIGDGVSYDSVYSICCSEGGWIDYGADGSGVENFYYGFETPVDVNTVDKITIRGMEFNFR